MKKLIKYILLALFVFVPLASWGQTNNAIPNTEQELASPDGNYLFHFYQKYISSGKKQMYYMLSYKGKSVIKESVLGIEIKNKLFENALGVPNDTCTHWCENLKIIGTSSDKKDTVWNPVYGEWSSIHDCYNAMTIKFMKGSDTQSNEGYVKEKCYYLNLEIRAYNEGVAFRYLFPETSNGLFLHITGEQTSFNFEDGTLAYHTAWAQGPYQLVTLKNWKNEAERPLTLKLPNGLNVSLLEAEMVNYARTKFKLINDNELQASIYGSVDSMTPFATSWRTIMVGEQPTDLINHDYLILNLNEPCKIKDTSWIKPGKVFRTGLKQAEAIDAVDFVAAHGMQYIHFDAGWYGPEMKMDSRATAVAPNKDLDIPQIVKYASSKGIGVILYVNQRALYTQLDSILPLYKKWGIKGIKFGFVQVGNQMWSTWLHDAVRKCAEYHLMVDIHDEYRPTGYSRTYPNLMTQEGIRGNEEMPDANHNTIIPFTRFLAGPADYTLCYYNSRVKNTHAHQLAMAVVYYSPLTWMFWYDLPKQYHNEPEIEFWEKVPTVWDETRALQGAPGEYIVTARRSHDNWFLGAMTNTSSRNIKVNTDFLSKGKTYLAHFYEDDSSVKTLTHVRCTTKKIKAGKDFMLYLQPSGGAAIWFEPTK